MTSSSMKTFSISPENKKAIDVWDKWKTQGVVIADRIAKLMIKYDEAEERAKLLLANDGLSSNEAFLASEAVKEAATIIITNPAIRKQEELRMKRLADEEAESLRAHENWHSAVIRDLKFTKDIDTLIKYLTEEEEKSTCKLCREEKEKMEQIKQRRLEQENKSKEVIQDNPTGEAIENDIAS
jgi:hypothetical protein